MVSAKIAFMTGIGAVVGTNIGWYFILKEEPQMKLSQVNPAYLTVGAIVGAIVGGTIGYVWEKYG